MKRLSVAVSVVIAAVLAVLVLGAVQPGASRGFHGNVATQAAKGTLRAPVITLRHEGRTIRRSLPFLSAGTVAAAQEALDAGRQGGHGGHGSPGIGQAPGTMGCSRRNRGMNVRVNQDCTFRRQAEEEITYNPADPSNLVAGQNDSRVGYNQCGIAWSRDSGRHWGDLLPPFRSRTNAPETMGPQPLPGNPNDNSIAHDPGTGHTYDAGSDPALAVDSRGRAYFSCVTFDVDSFASALYVTQSPRGANGSFYFNVPDAPAKDYMVVEDNSRLIAHDKQFIAADFHRRSPNRDNVYVTWTVFRFGEDCMGGEPDSPAQCESPIFGSMSTDQGTTWSTPEEISGHAPGLCFNGDALNGRPASADACNFDQGSDPVVLPDGDLEVVFNNENTPASDPNAQQLGVHCVPRGSSADGSARLNCDTPVRVGEDHVAGEPRCDFGRGPEECIPGPFIRTNDFPRIVTENSQNNHLYVVWQDYRDGEFDIQLSRSTDGGLHWTEAGTLNPDRGLDHYFPAVDQSPAIGDRVGAGYFRSERVRREEEGLVFAPCDEGGSPPPDADACAGVAEADSDYVLAGGTGVNVPYAFRPVSPVFGPPDGIQAGFNGDYSGLTINRGIEAHPLWSDTRNADPYAPANGVTLDEDVFTDTLRLPSGRGKPGSGRLGKG